MLTGEADGLVVPKQHHSALPGPYLAFAWVSSGIPNQGWELKGEATWKKKAQNQTVASFVRGGGRETLGPLCMSRVGSRKALLTDAHKRGILRPGSEFAPSSCWLRVHPDPAAAYGCNTKAAQALYGAFHAAAPSSHPSHPTENRRVGPGPTPGYSCQKNPALFQPCFSF